jgi:CDP-paratose 2-epimerase|tara:strand:- start:3327 stop:3632 length:306 start_codon:yes stop_codon:yes gene_type:complete
MTRPIVFTTFGKNPRVAEVYNIGGSRRSNCSTREAIDSCERITGKKVNYSYAEDNRIGDHIWWISDVSKLQDHYPDWRYEHDIDDIFEQIYDGLTKRTVNK